MYRLAESTRLRLDDLGCITPDRWLRDERGCSAPPEYDFHLLRDLFIASRQGQPSALPGGIAQVASSACIIEPV